MPPLPGPIVDALLMLDLNDRQWVKEKFVIFLV